MKLDRLMYLTVHIMTPGILLTVGLLWGHFISTKPIATNVMDNLAVIAIYYVISSIIWMLNMSTIRNIAESGRRR
ncbi:hypothetical protein [Cytobacillus sp.]|uniref:hypothetical protein n=1 Tax=Cytobacillus sp. TaxID=2675269 RepID=UPI003513C117